MRARLPVLVHLAILAVLAASSTACGSDGDGAEGPAGASGAEVEEVVILAIDNSFSPEEQVVPSGADVVWENRGRNEHDIVPEDPDAGWAVPAERFQPGDVVEFRFDEPGTYRYYCSIHGTIDIGMPGVLIVE